MKKYAKFIILFGIGAFLLMMAIITVLTIGAILISEEESESDGFAYEGFGYACYESNELDLATYENAFSTKGLLAPHADNYIVYSNKYNIDPVLLASISFLETANGTSKALKEKNNTGGLMGKNGLMSFNSIPDSLEVQARSIANIITAIIETKGEYKLEYLRDRYAPLGADNDPNNLNSHWLPNVISYSSQLGGFTMNCESADSYDEYGTVVVNGDIAYPLVKLVVTSSYGFRGTDPVTGEYESLHRGVDYACQKGEPVYAIMSGIVQTATYHSSWGNYVQILHSDGTGSLYGHLTSYNVKNGDTIKVGQQIGACGSTGNSTGNHLHLEFSKNGANYYDTRYLIDPHKMLISAMSNKSNKNTKKK